MSEKIESRERYHSVMERIYVLLDKSDLHRNEDENIELQRLCAAAEQYEKDEMGLEPNAPSETAAHP